MTCALPAALDRSEPDDIAITANASTLHSSLAPTPTLKQRRPDAAPARATKARRAPPRVATGIVCAAMLATLTLAGRERITARVPGADRLFAAIGLPVNLTGVEFRNVASKVTEIDGQKVLAVTGEVVNLRSAATTTLPGLTLTARGADGRALYVWAAQAATTKLAPGETVAFRTRLATPPEDARDVMVTLAEPNKVVAQATPGPASTKAGPARK